MSWEGLKNWDTEPAGAPPPPPPKPLAKRVPANVGPPADGCADPGCRDPTCAPLQRRGDGPRAEDLSQDRVRLQNAMLGLAKDNKAEEIERLCEAGLAATYGNSIGQTALHIAGIWNSVEAGEVLLDHGAKIDAQNDLSGMTPLHMAATRDRLEFCAMLLARGADPGIQDDSGRIAADVCQNTQLGQLLRLPKDSPDAGEALEVCMKPEVDKTANELKEQGNAFFKAGEYESALGSYTTAREMYRGEGRTMAGEKDFLVALLSNSSECMLRLGEPRSRSAATVFSVDGGRWMPPAALLHSSIDASTGCGL